MTDSIAVWDWEREPVPNASVVVCRPGFLFAMDGATPEMCMDHMKAVKQGAVFIHAEGEWSAKHKPPGRVIPALYAERQADLAGLPDMLAMRVERRALVLCPREALDLFADELCDNDHPYVDWVNLVVIIPPPEAQACQACDIDGRYGRCSRCDGRPTIEPWPMRPAWIRGIVEQCRAADVPVVFMGWGPIVQIPHGIFEVATARGCAEPREVWYRVGSERSGRLIDGAEVMEIPWWLS